VPAGSPRSACSNSGWSNVLLLEQCLYCWSNVYISPAIIFKLSDCFGVMIGPVTTDADAGKAKRRGRSGSPPRSAPSTTDAPDPTCLANEGAGRPVRPAPSKTGMGKETISIKLSKAQVEQVVCLAVAEEGLGVAAVAGMLRMGPSTTHRYMKTLLAVGLLEQDPSTRRYMLAGS
jgi:IclR helix-turn-helix domain